MARGRAYSSRLTGDAAICCWPIVEANKYKGKSDENEKGGQRKTNEAIERRPSDKEMGTTTNGGRNGKKCKSTIQLRMLGLCMHFGSGLPRA